MYAPKFQTVRWCELDAILSKIQFCVCPDPLPYQRPSGRVMCLRCGLDIEPAKPPPPERP